MKKSPKLNLAKLQVKSFITGMDISDNQAIRGGSSHDTKFQYCYEIYPREFHYEENGMP